uniref:Uncharacterized protein n=1 Tax=Trichuris muris TaxID=70415 RepID=A0A5S6QPA5_TRIMR
MLCAKAYQRVCTNLEQIVGHCFSIPHAPFVLVLPKRRLAQEWSPTKGLPVDSFVATAFCLSPDPQRTSGSELSEGAIPSGTHSRSHFLLRIVR